MKIQNFIHSLPENFRRQLVAALVGLLALSLTFLLIGYLIWQVQLLKKQHDLSRAIHLIEKQVEGATGELRYFETVDSTQPIANLLREFKSLAYQVKRQTDLFEEIYLLKLYEGSNQETIQKELWKLHGMGATRYKNVHDLFPESNDSISSTYQAVYQAVAFYGFPDFGQEGKLIGMDFMTNQYYAAVLNALLSSHQPSFSSWRTKMPLLYFHPLSLPEEKHPGYLIAGVVHQEKFTGMLAQQLSLFGIPCFQIVSTEKPSSPLSCLGATPSHISWLDEEPMDFQGLSLMIKAGFQEKTYLVAPWVFIVGFLSGGLFFILVAFYFQKRLPEQNRKRTYT